MNIKSFLAFTLLVSTLNSFAQNRLNSRLFYLKPPLFNSPTKITDFDLSNFNIIITEPIDNRNQFYGEKVYKNKKVQPVDEFFQRPTMIEIQQKIQSDFSSFKAAHSTNQNEIEINTMVEIFYPDARGFGWIKTFAKVRLTMIAKLNGKEVINKKYESFYITSGTDKEYEGYLTSTIEQAANVTLGMTLRKTLDIFYNDLKEDIKKHY